MSCFKTKWIILKKQKIKDKDFLYTIFTKDYWKILCNKKISKKEKTLDLWYIINFEILTKEEKSIHKVRNIKIKSEFNPTDKDFNMIHTYLKILALINNKIPKWNPIYEIFNIITYINNYKKIDNTKLILSILKIHSILWELWENNNNQTISKILKFINKNPIDNIFKLSWINKNLEKELDWIIL
jgi:hypothetical protein